MTPPCFLLLLLLPVERFSHSFVFAPPLQIAGSKKRLYTTRRDGGSPGASPRNSRRYARPVPSPLSQRTTSRPTENLNRSNGSSPTQAARAGGRTGRLTRGQALKSPTKVSPPARARLVRTGCPTSPHPPSLFSLLQVQIGVGAPMRASLDAINSTMRAAASRR